MTLRALEILSLSLLLACGGDGDSIGDDDDLIEEDEPIIIDCSELPPYDLPSLDCAQLGNAFESTVKASDQCNVKEDCIVVHPQCETWNAVICYYAANLCVDPQLMQSFNNEAGGCTDGSDTCDCEAAPDVDCIAHTCVLVPA